MLPNRNRSCYWRIDVTKKYRFICIDDMPNEVKRATDRLTDAAESLEIETQAPIEFSKQVGVFVQRRRDKKLDGIILDLRLDQSSPTGSRPVDYKAQRLASELRTKMAGGSLRDFPIVLWSISQKFARSYEKDIASHDLFDLVFNKDELHSAGEIQLAADQLVSLSKGYDSITNASAGAVRSGDLLKTPSGVVIDTRITASLGRPSVRLPVHVIARFILKKLVEHPGLLVDQLMLCARLGLDETSFESSGLDKGLDKFTYKGPFGDAWKRWWWPAVDNWWRKLDSDLPPVLSLTAEQRLTQLRRAGYKKLQAAEAIAKGYSSRFTTICQKLRKPLDPIDGFVLSGRRLESWQSRLYVSAEVATKPGRYRFDGEFDPLETDRLKEARAKVTRAKNKHG